MNRRGFFSRIAAAALAGVVLPRESPIVHPDVYRLEPAAFEGHASAAYSISEQYRRGVMHKPLGFIWQMEQCSVTILGDGAPVSVGAVHQARVMCSYFDDATKWEPARAIGSAHTSIEAAALSTGPRG